MSYKREDNGGSEMSLNKHLEIEIIGRDVLSFRYNFIEANDYLSQPRRATYEMLEQFLLDANEQGFSYEVRNPTPNYHHLEKKVHHLILEGYGGKQVQIQRGKKLTNQHTYIKSRNKKR